MYIVHVFIHVKPEFIDAFMKASMINAQASLQEPGVARFDVIQQKDNSSRFLLVEAYRNPEDAARHKETTHYNKWRETAEPMMSEPRTRTIYSNIFPSDMDW